MMWGRGFILACAPLRAMTPSVTPNSRPKGRWEEYEGKEERERERDVGESKMKSPAFTSGYRPRSDFDSVPTFLPSRFSSLSSSRKNTASEQCSGPTDRTRASLLTTAPLLQALKMNVTYHPAEYEEIRPGHGSLPPRSWNVESDSDQLSLNGNWRFRYSPIAAVPETFAQKTDFDDKSWKEIPVPRSLGVAWVWIAGLHQRQVPFPGRPTFCPHREPDG